MADVVRKRGRPIVGDGKPIQHKVRLSKKEADELDRLSEKLGVSKAEITREALKTYINLKNFMPEYNNI